MVQIFANIGTDEIILAVCTQDEVVKIKNLLNSKYRGNWILLDILKPLQNLKLNDGSIYEGYMQNVEIYCDAISKLKQEAENVIE